MSSRELVQKLINYWYTGDVAGAGEMFDERIHFRDACNPKGIIGKQNVINYLNWLGKASPGTVFVIDLVEKIEGADEFLVSWRYSIPDSMAGNTVVQEVYGVQFLKFQNGLLVKSHCFYDQVPLTAEILLSSRIAPKYNSWIPLGI